MKPKTRKRVRVSRTQMNITWRKGEEEKRKRFEAAVERAGTVANSVVRALIDEWTEVVLNSPETDIQKAVKRVAADK